MPDYTTIDPEGEIAHSLARKLWTAENEYGKESNRGATKKTVDFAEVKAEAIADTLSAIVGATPFAIREATRAALVGAGQEPSVFAQDSFVPWRDALTEAVIDFLFRYEGLA